MKYLTTFLFCLTLFSSILAQQQKRLALLIGNNDYVDAPLQNPENDARELGKVLESLGFESTVRYNLEMPSLERDIDAFCETIRKANTSGSIPVVCFYFSGHGMQISGTNFLIPVKHGITDQADVNYRAYSMNRLLEKLENAGGTVNIVILDACRNNPFEKTLKGNTKKLFPEMSDGLATVETTTVGTLIGFATSPGKTADDGGGENSPYAKALIKYLPTPGITIEQVFRNVRNDVYQETRETQLPWESSSLIGGDFYLNPAISITPDNGNKTGVNDKGLPIDFQNLEMKMIQGGTFQMGDVFDDGDEKEKPVHTVTLDSFLLSRYELTFAEYDAFCEETSREKPSDNGWGRGNRPVINVSWYDAIEYCNWRSEKEGLEPCYTFQRNTVFWKWDANGYRLPTEAEWEFAARQGGKQLQFGNGENWADSEEINFHAKKKMRGRRRVLSAKGEYRSKSVPVGSINYPNKLGLYDMSGNVREWCWDWDANYLPSPSGQDNPKGPTTGSNRILRGGSWKDDALAVRTSSRGKGNPGLKDKFTGFRLARSVSY